MDLTKTENKVPENIDLNDEKGDTTYATAIKLEDRNKLLDAQENVDLLGMSEEPARLKDPM